MNTSFSYAGECIGHTFSFADKAVQFYNNVTLEFMYTEFVDLRLVYPVLNFTGMIAEDFAMIPVTCFEFYVQFYEYWNNIWIQMNSDISIFI